MAEHIEWKNEKRRLSELVVWERNPRQIRGEQAGRLADSLDRFGQPEVFAIGPDGELYNGHQRLAVWGEKFGDIEVDVRVASRPLTEREREQLTAYLHAGAMGEWDWEELAGWDGGDLEAWGFDRGLLESVENDAANLALMLGVSEKEERAVKEREGGAREAQGEWRVERGQVWEIEGQGGVHRLVCGDSREKAVVQKVLLGEEAQLLVTSPPYWVGMAYEAEGSEAEIDAFIGASVGAWAGAVSVNHGRMVINTGTAAIHRIDGRRRVEVLPLIDKWQKELRTFGWIARHFRVWVKGGDLPASIAPDTDVVDQHWEHLVSFDSEWSYLGTWWAPGGKQRGQEKIGISWAQQGIWDDIQGERSAEGLHVVAFPVEIPRRFILLYTKPGEIVLDPFVGCGTTIVACEQNGRVGRGIDYEPRYISAALQRLSEIGLEPKLVLSAANELVSSDE